MGEQVALQKDIIDILRSGSRDGIDADVKRAQEIQQQVTVQDRQVETLRENEETAWNAL
jgi:hypothetical protein